jgi:hypothetical protein
MRTKGKDTSSAMKRVWLLQLLLVLLVPHACWAHRGDTAYPVSRPETIGVASPVRNQDTGILEGKIRKGPLSPMIRPGGPSADAGLAGAQVDIATVDGKPVASVRTDSAGNFRIRLPPGTYNVTMHSHGAMFTRDLPATVTILANHEQRLDILLDTGIR